VRVKPTKQTFSRPNINVTTIEHRSIDRLAPTLAEK
jgi:hypothetical protein